MKRLLKFLSFIVCAGTVLGSAFAATACNNGNSGKKGEAYSLVHSSESVGCSTVTVNGGKITAVTLNEVCLPKQVKTTDGEYYAKVTYGGVTLLWDDTLSNYKTEDGTAFKTYLAESAHAEEYYKAVMGNRISAYESADGAAKTNVMTKAKLSKDENGYWGTANTSGGQKLNWKQNRDATVSYVLAHGVDGLSALTRNADNYWVDTNGVSTGATWTDLYGNNNVASGEGAVTYAQLIKNAYDKAAQ